MSRTVTCFLIVVTIFSGFQSHPVYAQEPTPVPRPVPNALLIYDRTTVALINISSNRLSLVGLTFMRAGGTIKFDARSMLSSLAPGQCIQVWTTEVNVVIGKPSECGVRPRWQKLSQKNTYFWVADYENEPFRPQLNGDALTICKATTKAVKRCSFYLPQGDDATESWAVLDPISGMPMPAGIQVAYDSNQIWIANLIPDTVLPTQTLRLFYTVTGQNVIWTPSRQNNWDTGTWDNRGLLPNQCLVLYQDPTKITPLLPCTPIGRAVLTDMPWKVQFDVMGPREERRVACGNGEPTNGPVLCVLPG